MILLALRLGIKAVVMESGNWQEVHGWQTALAARLNVKVSVLASWIRRGNIPSRRALDISKHHNVPVQLWYRFDLTPDHITNMLLYGDPDKKPEEPPVPTGQRKEPEGNVLEALIKAREILEAGGALAFALNQTIESLLTALRFKDWSAPPDNHNQSPGSVSHG